MLTLETEARLSYIQPNWPAPPQVRAYQTTRQGGFGRGQQASFSLGMPQASLGLGSVDNTALAEIKANRQKLITDLGLEAFPPLWLQQVHGNHVVDLGANADKSQQDCVPPSVFGTFPHKGGRSNAKAFVADACFSRKTGQVCAVQTADCLPILLCDRRGTVVAAIHGGWRSVLADIIEITVAALPVKSTELLAWLGPAIGPRKFEVGEEVYYLFTNYDEQAASCFTQKKDKKWLANLYQLAKQRLLGCGVEAIYGGDYCTYSQEDLFFSYRRDAGQTGRMATLIWLNKHRNSES